MAEYKTLGSRFVTHFVGFQIHLQVVEFSVDRNTTHKSITLQKVYEIHQLAPCTAPV